MKYNCPMCDGIGYVDVDMDPACNEQEECDVCKGKGEIDENTYRNHYGDEAFKELLSEEI